LPGQKTVPEKVVFPKLATFIGPLKNTVSVKFPYMPSLSAVPKGL